MDIQVLDHNPLYLDQIYRLRFRFSNNYPIGMLSLSSPIPLPSPFICPPTKQVRLTTLHRTSRSRLPPPKPHLPRPTHALAPTIFPCPYKRHHTLPASTLLRQLTPTATDPHHPHPPAHLLQRHHLPGPSRLRRLEPRPERRERLHEHSEHANREHEERAAGGGRTVCQEQHAAAEGYHFCLS